VFAQQNRNVSDKRYEADYAADDVFFAVQEGLAGRVELGVVCDVVVALCEEAQGGFATGELAHSYSSPFPSQRAYRLHIPCSTESK
jgi:hypothetical protein